MLKKLRIRPTTSNVPRGDAGMTLAELLVAMGLTVVMGAMTLSFFLTANTSTARTIDTNVSNNAAAAVLDTWAQAIRAIDLPTLSFNNGDNDSLFCNAIVSASGSELVFYSDLGNRGSISSTTAGLTACSGSAATVNAQTTKVTLTSCVVGNTTELLQLQGNLTDYNPCSSANLTSGSPQFFTPSGTITPGGTVDCGDGPHTTTNLFTLCTGSATTNSSTATATASASSANIGSQLNYNLAYTTCNTQQPLTGPGPGSGQRSYACGSDGTGPCVSNSLVITRIIVAFSVTNNSVGSQAPTTRSYLTSASLSGQALNQSSAVCSS